MQAQHIAGQFDDHFVGNRLFDFDQQVLAQYVRPPGIVLDLGCGTGRSSLALARRGLTCVGVDLSYPMLRVMGEKAADQGLLVNPVRANLVELDCFRGRSVDYCICMFSTLGMIRGAGNRRRALVHARRILKPGGLMILHAHNLWHNLFNRRDRRWLRRHLIGQMAGRSGELGDKTFDYRGISDMFLHTYTRGELLRSIREARFEVERLIPLAPDRDRPLRHAWALGRWRANGWIVVCRKATADG